ncbi:histidine phosphatase family protein [Fredinandcohnia sp. 179-A 10B2 NHS]|uniref:histidine phosphatase family protein n=1 Tax=Fredinandcohnia sp. 179-A 10B2 NHS TaxID=3235176 RepID=UPI0039A1FE9E
MLRLGIIRHGTTEWNKAGRAQGSSDIPLDQEGLAEAIKLATRLSGEEWNIIYSSPLKRASQTAETIKKNLKHQEIYFDKRLQEVGGGLIEGTTEEERISKWGVNWREVELGVEQPDSVYNRGISFIEEIKGKHPSDNVLVVSHGAFIRHMLRRLVPQQSLEDKLKNTSITVITYKENSWDIELYNCTRHLES